MNSTHSKVKNLLAVLAGTAVLFTPVALAADHQDGPATTADPAADITDVFAWMTDATHAALVMNVSPVASSASGFSDVVKYVFHTSTHDKLVSLGGVSDQEIDVICTFDSSQDISCWVTPACAGAACATTTPAEFITGPASSASAAAGISSSDGLVTVFAGLRDDPFFFNLDGFHAVVADVTAAVPALVTANAFDAAGCPNLSLLGAGTAAALAGDLGLAADGGVPVDHFNGLNVLSIVVKIDTSLLKTTTNTLLSVWGSTNQ